MDRQSHSPSKSASDIRDNPDHGACTPVLVALFAARLSCVARARDDTEVGWVGAVAGPELGVQRKFDEASCHRCFLSAPNSLLTSSALLQPIFGTPDTSRPTSGFNP